MNAKLQEAVAIFKELGWEGVTPENILELPLGTPEQKRTALAGLKSGEWSEWIHEGNTYKSRSCFDVDGKKLAMFAIRVGVDAQRAVSIAYWTDGEMLVSAIAERGAKYALDFIKYACVSRRRVAEHSMSVFGNVAVKLVDRLDLDIPQSVEYMKDWSWCADIAMDLKDEPALASVSHFLKFDRRNTRTDLPDLESIKGRFEEHIVTGVAVGAPATGFFALVFLAGVKRGWLSREKAMNLVFSALDAAVRPGDRKVWLEVLDELDIRDEELCARAQALIPLLANGESAVIERLAPVLITGVNDSLLSEVLMAAFSATTKKTKQLVLKSALDRPGPENAEDLAPWLSILAGDKDKSVVFLAAKLTMQWGVSVQALPEEQADTQGLWRETPPLWKVPPFELGEVSPEALTELAAELVRRPETAHDVTTERFLAVANAVAYENPEAARISLRGLRSGSLSQLLGFMLCWIKGEVPRWGLDTDEKRGTNEPLAARDCIVSLNLGKQPCLLSTPSTADLSVSVQDLVSRLALYKNECGHCRISGAEKYDLDARLALYKKGGSVVQEADLFLALTRLDVDTKTEEAVKALSTLDIPVVLQSGKTMPVTAGQAVLTYLENPFIEPPLEKSGRYWRGDIDISTSKSLYGFPNRFDSYQPELFSVFPRWGDAALTQVRWGSEVYHHKGLILRQVARRAEPLPPGASVNFLAAQRSSTPDAAADSMLAVTEAWERGLLRPGVADVSLLDWNAGEPYNLAAFAAALDGIARDGLLSVVWPVLDAVIERSLKAPRLLAGTAEFAELVEVFLSETQLAVEKGLAGKEAFLLPGIRALARRGGTSRAVSAAQKVASLLPPEYPALPKEEKATPSMEQPFDEIWPASNKTKATLIDDGVTMTVDCMVLSASIQQLRFTLTLPDISDSVFHVVKGWTYDLENEGQCQAWATAPGEVVMERDRKQTVWLHWDTKQKAMAVCNHRNWADGKDGPLDRKGIKIPPLPFSLLTVIVGLLAQDGDAIYFAPRLLNHFIKSGQIDDMVVRKATQTLLQYPAVSPAKLARALEKDVKLLPVLWPILTESIKAAGMLTQAVEKPPVWVNRILDIALRYAPYLAEARERGHIPKEDAQWTGLSDIASSKAKSTAVEKAKKLQATIIC